jgi:site-specific recombinase XerD
MGQARDFIPVLKRHHTGVHFTTWGGRDRYFTRDVGESQRLFERSLEEYLLWRQQRPDPTPRGALTVGQLAVRFLHARREEVDPRTYEYYRKHLSRFVRTWAEAPACRITPMQLQALKTDLLKLGYKPATVNHDLGSVKTMFKWGAAVQLIPSIDLSGIPACALEPLIPKAYPRWQVKWMVMAPLQSTGEHCLTKWAEQATCCAGAAARPATRGARTDRAKRRDRHQPGCPLFARGSDPEPAAPPEPRLSPWIELQYLAAMRPTEVIKLVHGEGAFEEEGIFRLHTSKVSRRTQEPRRIVLTPRALEVLRACEPVWGSLDSYSAAVRRTCGPGGPGPLRHSAASHLLQAGAARADIDLILGHLPPRVSRIYAPVAWQPLRATAARITL